MRVFVPHRGISIGAHSEVKSCFTHALPSKRNSWNGIMCPLCSSLQIREIASCMVRGAAVNAIYMLVRIQRLNRLCFTYALQSKRKSWNGRMCPLYVSLFIREIAACMVIDVLQLTRHISAFTRYLVLRAFCARINHPFIRSAHLHCPPWCNSVA